LVSATDDLYLIVDEATAGRLTEVSRLLALIGIDRIAGWIGTSAVSGGAVLQSTPQMTVTDLEARLATGAVTVVDVRSANEWAGGHVPGAMHIPLGYLAGRCRTIPTTRPIVLQCQSGSRSAIAVSLLEHLGIHGAINLQGGLSAWAAAGLPVEGARHEQAARA
jgi:hydroxyacylglutathione hydrolase